MIEVTESKKFAISPLQRNNIVHVSIGTTAIINYLINELTPIDMLYFFDENEEKTKVCLKKKMMECKYLVWNKFFNIDISLCGFEFDYNITTNGRACCLRFIKQSHVKTVNEKKEKMRLGKLNKRNNIKHKTFSNEIKNKSDSEIDNELSESESELESEIEREIKRELEIEIQLNRKAKVENEKNDSLVRHEIHEQNKALVDEKKDNEEKVQTNTTIDVSTNLPDVQYSRSRKNKKSEVDVNDSMYIFSRFNGKDVYQEYVKIVKCLDSIGYMYEVEGIHSKK